MALKGLIYIVTVIITIWALESLNISGIFKKNRYYSSRVLYLIVAMALSYLVVNFFYDIFESTRFI